MMMKGVRRSFWPIVGLLAVAFSSWLLYRELHGISVEDVIDRLAAIPPPQWGLAGMSALVAYAALAWYDRIALLHLGKTIPWPFVVLCAFTTYALAHNIGAPVLSGTLVRYRAYRTRGLTPLEIGVLIALCSFTFLLGTVMLGGLMLLALPELPRRLMDAPEWASRASGAVLLGGVALYVLGSWLHLQPIKVAGLQVYYPRLAVVGRQLVVAPLELMGAAGVIYFALPEAVNPGYLVVLTTFLASFSAALLSHAPGGLGVLELVFVTALPDIDPADVLAALIVFRLFYLLIPLAIALVVVIAFEWRQLRKAHPDGAKLVG